MKTLWQRTCPVCHNAIEWYPFPKQTEMEFAWRPVIPCGACGARLRRTKAQLVLQLVLMSVGFFVLIRWGPLWPLLSLAAGWLLFRKLKLEVVPPKSSG